MFNPSSKNNNDNNDNDNKDDSNINTDIIDRDYKNDNNENSVILVSENNNNSNNNNNSYNNLKSFLFIHKVNKDVSYLNLITSYLGSFLSICFLVFINVAQPYILNSLNISDDRQGNVSGNISFCNEVVIVLASYLWGILSDKVGRRIVYSAGMFIIGIGLAIYPFANSILCLMIFRVVFAIGAASCSSMLSAVLADYIPFIDRGKASGLLGFSAGGGAVLASLVLLKIPDIINNNSSLGPSRSTELTYGMTAGLAVIGSVILFTCLQWKSKESSIANNDRKSILTIALDGLKAGKKPLLSLAYGSGFLARGDSAIATTFLSLWIYQYTLSVNGGNKTDALSKSGTISGIAQTCALFFALFAGFLCDRMNRIFAMVLLALVGCFGYFLLAFSENPLTTQFFVGACIIGCAETGMVVSSTALVAQESPIELRGSVSGFFAQCGSLGILVASLLGGVLYDQWKGFPFALFGGFSAILSIWGLIIFFITQYQSNLSPINGSPCPKAPSVDLKKGECDSNFFIMQGPKVIIHNFYMYTDIKFQPLPISKAYEGGVLQVELDYETTYNITFENPNCPDGRQGEDVTTNSGPRLKITQPKCMNSFSTIDFDDGEDQPNNQRTFQINGGTVLLPHEIKFDGTDEKKFYTFLDGRTECQASFYLYQGGNQGVPDIQVFPATCGSGGRILLLGSGEYSSVALYNSLDSIIPPTTNIDNFENLKSGDYYFVLESSACGKQRFEIIVPTGMPEYELTLFDDSCPISPIYEMSVDGYDFTVIVNGNRVNSTFTRTLGQSVEVEILKCGTFNVPFKDIASIPPIHYSISETNFCQETAILHYDPDVVGDITIEVLNTNTGQPSTTHLESDNSFTVNDPSMFIYNVKSECYSEPIKILSVKREPNFVISNKTNYCNELVDITVTNYLDFKDIYLYLGGEYIYPVNGVFKQVLNQRYSLYYQRFGFCNSESLSINDHINKANIYVKSKMSSDPNCLSESTVFNISIFDAFTNQFIVSINQSVSQYSFPDQQYTYDLAGANKLYCNAVFKFDYELTKPQIIIETLSKPICKYSQDGGIIIITGSREIQDLYVDNYPKTPGAPIEVSAGNHSITGIFKSYCGDFETYYFVDSQFPSFKVEYDITPVSNCINGDGNIAVKDYSKYASLEIDGAPYSGVNSQDYSSKNYNVSFSIDLGSSQICRGFEMVFLPTSIAITPSYRIVQQPLCDEDEQDTSGVVVIDYIKNKNGQEYPIEFTNGRESSSMDGLAPGMNELNVVSGSCSWNIQVNVPVANVTITPVLDLFTVKECNSYSRYRLDFNNEYAALTSSSDENTDPLTKFYVTVDSFGTKTVGVNYGRRCFKYITLEVNYPKLPQIKYTITYNGEPGCASSINIQVEDYKKYEVLKYGDAAINPDGFFSNVIPGQYLYYRLFNLSCTIPELIIIDEQPTISRSTVNESCNEAYTGKLSVLDADKNNYYYLLQNIDNSYENDFYSTYPVKSNQDKSSFEYIGGQNVRLLKIKKDQPTCIIENKLEYSGSEPQLLINVNDQCSDELGSVSIVPDISGLEGTYTLGDPNTPTSTPSQTPSSTPSPTMPLLVDGSAFALGSSSSSGGVSAGNYSLLYTITSDFCKRNFHSFINVPYSESINVSVTACQTVQFVPKNLNQTYSYTIFKPNQESIETHNITGTFSYNSFNESGTFILQVSSGSCIKNHTLSIEKCNNSKSNVGLIVGLVLGLVALATIIALGIFLYKKRVSGTKVKDVAPIQHELSTVKFYQGGKIVEADKF
ncbi:hypothetical protein DICPUDRAFT_157347 [Dictyostelium purpureum]|uniref:Major facilitator superfamily (MFS) profile domain-containing protein n=1 Tax=Dictyostelium purpureum TaxID=5786 RepID=F0ZYW8_DICPU|nr:uncharacterized protein DICPUDRAFT_157347 [Dictyostelium purpureum]EGC30876.1 hypothetical protein DICPUDRAFT_157347 [Dictyostelium purpureum]|eukprot:XP_003292613.1 hypothetical protein DICPUDRAFT_157347 [Dictyostelium purpureum]